MKTISKKTTLVFGICSGLALLSGCEGDDTATSGFGDPAPAASGGYTQGEGFASQRHQYGYCQPITTSSAPRDFAGCAPAQGDARAYVASANVLGLAKLSVEDTGDVHTSPGVTDTLLTVSSPGLLSAGVVSSSASSSSSGVNAAASVAGLNLSVLGVGITADAVDTTANASCGVAHGSTIITNLKIAGVHVDVDATPNATIAVGTLLKVVLNEQVAIANGISVRAIHVSALDGSADVIIALSNASTTASCCTATPDSGPPSSPSSDGGIVIVIPDPIADGGVLPPILDPLLDSGVLPPILDPLTDGGLLPPILPPLEDSGVLPPILPPLFDGGVLPPILPLTDGGVLPPIPDPTSDGGILPPPSHPADAGPPSTPPSDAGTPVPGTPCDNEHSCGPDMICVPVLR